jgi:limonene-1,2-epoxide hydrolase
MLRAAGDLVTTFAGALNSGDVRRLDPFLAEDVEAWFDEAGRLSGRRALLAFWRRLFQTYPIFELHIVKAIAQDDLAIAEAIYLLGPSRGPVLSVRAIAVYEIKNNLIARWTDHADLAEVPMTERERWRRLGAARW